MFFPDVKLWRGILLASLFFILSGCSSNLAPLALTTDPADTGLSKQLILVSLTTKNAFHPAYQPIVQSITVRNLDSGKDTQFAVGKPCAVVDGYNKYLLSFTLPQGNYEIRDASGYAEANHIKGTFYIPIDSHFSVGQDGIMYLGNINATLQPCTNAVQLHAGPGTPLFDQTVTGFSIGTFVITMNDNYAEDMTDFASEYPALIDQDVNKAILSAKQQ
jgi:hypothetical protein